MPHACQDVGGGVWEEEDRDRTKVSGEAEDEGAMSRVWSRGRGRVADDTTSESARCGMGVTKSTLS